MTEPNWQEIVKGLRETGGQTQEQLARDLGMTMNIVSRWERGLTKPSPLARRAIAKLVRKAKRQLPDTEMPGPDEVAGQGPLG
jgi:transcriptional regulator with XRE-family HTH domain